MYIGCCVHVVYAVLGTNGVVRMLHMRCSIDIEWCAYYTYDGMYMCCVYDCTCGVVCM